MELNFKEKQFFEYMKSLTDKKVVVAFSGGVDSSLVLKTAIDVSSANDVYAITFDTLLSPKNDIDITKKLAEDFGVRLEVVQTNEIEDEKILYNDKQRCYYCKKNLFENAIKLKEKLGFGYVLDGSNADDANVYRPGRKALKELGIISPLEKTGMSKNEVRQLAKKLGIKVHNRPSSPCLMTRFPYNKKVDISIFPKIDEVENYLKSLGFDNNRVRLYGDVTRIEVDVDKFPLFFEKRLEIIKKFKETGFVYVNLDIEGFRSGSMDIVIDKD
ncbi:MAG: ATP-dependent sacrificial sulfur transferase LarE [Peptoanaerobacter stomatis]|uniref:ATP-dependent sacrificial sulfur transferase LarE n=1 Tax=Peptoanaerobacter stomatis TaxID=796937 RepID=UPI003FA05C94